jgi:hypothetical protein
VNIHPFLYVSTSYNELTVVPSEKISDEIIARDIMKELEIPG